jgi:protoporphyrinogen/coproporphyrinogen III oxidase
VNIIVGGGITGLTCAYQLHKRGLPFRIVEKGELGGLVRSESIEGFTLESGPNVLLLKPALRELLESLDLTDRIVLPTIKNYRQYIWYKGQACEVPRNLVALVRSSLLSFSEKWQLLRGLVTKTRSSQEDESIEELFSKFLPRDLVQRILDPALRGIYGGRIASLSSQIIFPGLWEYLKEEGSLLSYARYRRRVAGPARQRAQVCVIRGGAFSLVQNIAEKLPVESFINQEVKSLLCREDGSFPLQFENGQNCAAERVFVTTSGSATAHFLKDVAPQLSKELKEIRYAPIVVAHVKIPQSTILPTKGFGVLFPYNYSSNLLGIMFNSMLFPHVAPLNSHLVTLCFGGIQGEAVLDWSDEKIRLESIHALQKTFGVKKAEMLNCHRWHRAVPQLDVGSTFMIHKMRQVESDYPGLFFIGVDQGGIGVPDRVARSYECLEKIAA